MSEDLASGKAEWARKVKGAQELRRTTSGRPARPLYTPEDTAGLDYLVDLGFPGEFPFTRGVHSTMYLGKPWTIRQYSGFGTAEDTNRRYRSLLERGQTGLSVALDLPTQIGFDADDPAVEDEVGRIGVAITTLADMEQLFEGIPLDKVSTNFTINTTAGILLAMYVTVAERQGVAPAQVSGTLQNDPLKEFISRGTWLYPVGPSIRLAADVIEYCAREVLRFNPISISGAHLQQAGATSLESVAFAFANAVEYIEAVLARGLSIDEFAPRLSFNLGVVGMDFFEEVARFRAARRLWARLIQERYRPHDPRSAMLRFYTGCGGNSLTIEEPLNNVVRVSVEALAAVLGGAQAVHTCSYDEAYAIPTEASQHLALRTQQILAYEAGVTRTIDPLAGSYAVEALTAEAEGHMRGMLAEVERRGGMLKAIEEGYIQRRILHSAYEEERRIRSGEKVVVGVNKFAGREAGGQRGAIELHRADPEVVRRQVARVREVKARRDAVRARDALCRVAATARGTANVMPAIAEAVKADCTVGEIAGALRAAWGTYEELVAIAAGPAERVSSARPAGRPIKMLLAKPGLDGHDRGAKVLALALRDAGIEVIYTGLRNSVEQIVNAAAQEDVQLIGLSVLSGAHLGLAEKLMSALREGGMADVQVVVGGTIPDQGIAPLKALGVSAVFPAGSRLDEVIESVKRLGVPPD